jgi:hypothetical protein
MQRNRAAENDDKKERRKARNMVKLEEKNNIKKNSVRRIKITKWVCRKEGKRERKNGDRKGILRAWGRIGRLVGRKA